METKAEGGGGGDSENGAGMVAEGTMGANGSDALPLANTWRGSIG